MTAPHCSECAHNRERAETYRAEREATRDDYEKALKGWGEARSQVAALAAALKKCWSEIDPDGEERPAFSACWACGNDVECHAPDCFIGKALSETASTAQAWERAVVGREREEIAAALEMGLCRPPCSHIACAAIRNALALIRSRGSPSETSAVTVTVGGKLVVDEPTGLPDWSIGETPKGGGGNG